MSFIVYLYSTFGLYGCFDPLLGMLTSHRYHSISEGIRQSDINHLATFHKDLQEKSSRLQLGCQCACFGMKANPTVWLTMQNKKGGAELTLPFPYSNTY
jgi:hypothetical protein